MYMDLWGQSLPLEIGNIIVNTTKMEIHVHLWKSAKFCCKDISFKQDRDFENSLLKSFVSMLWQDQEFSPFRVFEFIFLWILSQVNKPMCRISHGWIKIIPISNPTCKGLFCHNFNDVLLLLLYFYISYHLPKLNATYNIYKRYNAN